jgi:hypothetical protein
MICPSATQNAGDVRKSINSSLSFVHRGRTRGTFPAVCPAFSRLDHHRRSEGAVFSAHDGATALAKGMDVP